MLLRTIFSGISFTIQVVVALAGSFYVTENEGSNLAIRKEHFLCDRKQSCSKIERKTDPKQLPQVPGKEADNNVHEDKDVVWKKVLQIYRSCKEALGESVTDKSYLVQHKNMAAPITVRCRREEGKILALFGHDSETKVSVTGFEDSGSYRRTFKYDSSIRDIAAFVDSSLSCKQFTRIDCFHMVLTKYGFLVDRNGASMQYIGGGPANGEGCSCGITNTCAVSGKRCNCDANDGVWRFDEGYVIEKARLPLTQVRLGDTGDENEKGAHTIGELICEE